jgi:hypothetical protein
VHCIPVRLCTFARHPSLKPSSCRYLSEEEYLTWSVTYDAAASSVRDRDDAIDRANELIEHSLLILGATALEDKLQEGVPDAIEQLHRAGIKLWILTGRFGLLFRLVCDTNALRRRQIANGDRNRVLVQLAQGRHGSYDHQRYNGRRDTHTDRGWAEQDRERARAAGCKRCSED